MRLTKKEAIKALLEGHKVWVSSVKDNYLEYEPLHGKFIDKHGNDRDLNHFGNSFGGIYEEPKEIKFGYWTHVHKTRSFNSLFICGDYSTMEEAQAAANSEVLAIVYIDINTIEGANLGNPETEAMQ